MADNGEPSSSQNKKTTQSGNGKRAMSSDKPAEGSQSQKKQGPASADTSETSAPRGPAFPRRGSEQDGADSEETEEPGSDEYQEQLPDGIGDAENDFEQENMEAVKNQLLDLFRTRQEEHGTEVESHSFEEVDPGESAENFLEFLQNITMSEDEGSEQWQE